MAELRSADPRGYLAHMDTPAKRTRVDTEPQGSPDRIEPIDDAEDVPALSFVRREHALPHLVPRRE